jgi:hypothetical protein
VIAVRSFENRGPINHCRGGQLSLFRWIGKASPAAFLERLLLTIYHTIRHYSRAIENNVGFRASASYGFVPFSSEWTIHSWHEFGSVVK